MKTIHNESECLNPRANGIPKRNSIRLLLRTLAFTPSGPCVPVEPERKD